jgi:LysR family positive regulator for ilvC
MARSSLTGADDLRRDRGGCGVGVVPRLVLEKSALRDRIIEVPVRPALRQFRVGLCIRERSRDNPLVSAIWRA